MADPILQKNSFMAKIFVHSAKKTNHFFFVCIVTNIRTVTERRRLHPLHVISGNDGMWQGGHASRGNIALSVSLRTVRIATDK